jgi:hypothetical protein
VLLQGLKLASLLELLVFISNELFMLSTDLVCTLPGFPDIFLNSLGMLKTFITVNMCISLCAAKDSKKEKQMEVRCPN